MTIESGIRTLHRTNPTARIEFYSLIPGHTDAHFQIEVSVFVHSRHSKSWLFVDLVVPSIVAEAVVVARASPVDEAAEVSSAVPRQKHQNLV